MNEGGPFRTGWLELSGIRMGLREAGAGKVLVAFDRFGRALSDTHHALAERHRLVALGIPDTGTLHTPGLLTTAIERLGIRKCNLIAHGPYAAAALNIAAIRRDLVEAVVLIGPTAADGDEPLGELEIPVLILAGMKDEPARAVAHRYKAGLANGHLVLVYDAGAEMDAERPEAVVSVLKDFLERHDRFIVKNDSGKLFP